MTLKLNGSSSGSVSIDAPAATTGGADITFSLPIADGSSGQALVTNASGQLSFAGTGCFSSYAVIGDKKAKVLLEPCTTEQQMFNKVREMYGNDEEFLMNANCLWILRNERETFTERFAQLQE